MKKILFGLIVLGIAFFLLQGFGFVRPDQSSVQSMRQSSISFSSASSVAEVQSSSSATAASSLGNSSISSASSSLRPLSFPRVDPPEHIDHFLKSMDETAVPKMQLPKVKKDETFDYAQATVAQLKERALAGDAYAALYYANYIASNVLRIPAPKGGFMFEFNSQKQAAGLAEMREFYVRAMQGGLREAAFALSREYYAGGPWFNAEESLAWRKISFALGERETFDCVRDSTLCTVKDYNDLMRDAQFFPCVGNARDNCSPELYQDATLLAMQYVYSADFAMHNVPPKRRGLY